MSVLERVSHAYHEYVKGKTQNAVAIAAGGNSQVDLVTTGFEYLTLLARMTAAVAGDLTVAVHPYEDDGSTEFGNGVGVDMIAGAVVTSAYTGALAISSRRYDLKGIDKVRVILINNNAAPQTASCTYYLEK